MRSFDYIRQTEDKNILIASHRGVSGGNIPCNSLEAFEIALRQGADIIECDVTKSIDGKLFIFHPGTEPAWLNQEIDIRKMTSEQIRALRQVNIDLTATETPIYSLDDALEFLKGRCYINLDKCWTCLPEIVKTIRRHKIEEQILLKSSPKMEYLKQMEELAPDIRYLPIFFETDTASELIESMNINYYGAEVVFSTEASLLAEDEYIEKMHKKGRKLWGNAIVYYYKRVLSAGHTDDISLTKNPDDGWGWLADKKYDIIQTDWPGMLRQYLESTGKLQKKWK
ncbi:MAG: glycerophosphodiester phosphodiesterase family protein [Clostridiales bacterium]|nr:glycerophosphodiester phosphodiesterase family protein [Clostridiales bacterium]